MRFKINHNKMKKNGNSNGDQNIHNLIAQGTSIKGDIETDGDLRIDGNLVGTIVTKGKLVIGSSASIEGSIKCENADISGKVVAQIVVNQLVVLNESSRFSGDIITKKISIEPGAVFSGNCQMASEGMKPLHKKTNEKGTK